MASKWTKIIEETSIISDIFFGFNEIINECLNCKKRNLQSFNNNPINYNYEIFNYLIFPFNEIKKKKNIKNNCNINNIYLSE